MVSSTWWPSSSSHHKAHPVNTGCAKNSGEYMSYRLTGPLLAFSYYINCSIWVLKIKDIVLGTSALGACWGRKDTHTGLHLLPCSPWGLGHSMCSGFSQLLSQDIYPAVRSPPLSHSAIIIFKIVRKESVFLCSHFTHNSSMHWRCCSWKKTAFAMKIKFSLNIPTERWNQQHSSFFLRTVR